MIEHQNLYLIMSNHRGQTVLIFGATGNLGYHITIALLHQNYKVKLQRLYSTQADEFQNIYEGQITDDLIMKTAFTGIDYVVSALGARPEDKGKVQTIEYQNQLKIIQHSKKNRIQRLVLISAAMMERPWHPFAVFLNTLIPDVFHWKQQTQNQLRSSGLNYSIIRPPYLYDDKKPTGYHLGQGDKLLGKITRKTVGLLVADSLNCIRIPSRVTFECTQAPISQNDGFQSLKSDTLASIVMSNHKRAKKTYWVCLLLITIFLILQMF